MRKRRRAAADRIAKGETFDAIAKERGLTEKDIDLGTVTKSAIIDRAVADAAFALKEGEVSAPVQGRFGTVIVRVPTRSSPRRPDASKRSPRRSSAISPPSAPRPRSRTIYDKIEDERSEGKTLAEAAAGLKLAAHTIEIDRSGRDPSGAPAKALPEPEQLLSAIFSSRRRRRQRPAALRGWLRLVRSDRHQPGARPHARRGQGPGRGALARGRDRVRGCAARRRAARQGQGRQRRWPTPPLPSTSRSRAGPGSSACSPPPPLSVAGIGTIFRTAKDVAGIADAEQPGEQIVFRVTDVDGADDRPAVGTGQAP